MASQVDLELAVLDGALFFASQYELNVMKQLMDGLSSEIGSQAAESGAGARDHQGKRAAAAGRFST